MSENLKLLKTKLTHLSRMQEDLEYSVGKMVRPLSVIQSGNADSLTPEERETISAFTGRFADFQEHLSKTMKTIAIEEESDTSPFGAVLALMEKLGVLDDVSHWKAVRELRNCINHEYEDDPGKLCLVLGSMVDNSPFLFNVFGRMQKFVAETYGV